MRMSTLCLQVAAAIVAATLLLLAMILVGARIVSSSEGFVTGF